MKRSDWYFIGLMICAANANVFGALAAMIVMFISYIAACKREDATPEKEKEE